MSKYFTKNQKLKKAYVALFLNDPDFDATPNHLEFVDNVKNFHHIQNQVKPMPQTREISENPYGSFKSDITRHLGVLLAHFSRKRL